MNKISKVKTNEARNSRERNIESSGRTICDNTTTAITNYSINS